MSNFSALKKCYFFEMEIRNSTDVKFNRLI